MCYILTDVKIRDKKADFVQNLLGHIKLTHSAISLSYYNIIQQKHIDFDIKSNKLKTRPT